MSSRLPDIMREPKDWTNGELQALIAAFLPAIERDTQVPLRINYEQYHCGDEGCVYFARCATLGDVVLKIGINQFYDEAYGDKASDFLVSAQIVGLFLPGVARVFGVWQKDQEYFALLRERVSTDWLLFRSAEAGCLSQMPDPDEDEGVNDVEAALYQVGQRHHRDCAPGEHGFIDDEDARLVLVEYGLSSLRVGLTALKKHGICAGFDLRLDNVGYRRVSGGHEAVMLDIGTAAPEGQPFVKEPRVANCRGKR